LCLDLSSRLVFNKNSSQQPFQLNKQPPWLEGKLQCRDHQPAAAAAATTHSQLPNVTNLIRQIKERTEGEAEVHDKKSRHYSNKSVMMCGNYGRLLTGQLITVHRTQFPPMTSALAPNWTIYFHLVVVVVVGV
jgi:hypothetical protein